MQRKILTFKNTNGLVEDLIPYVDGKAIQIGGTNLEDYLAQIEDNIERALLYLGAYESEQALLLKHPNGSDLKEGSYAIVTDEDALYIYDTDGKRWLKTASATIGILQLNGLTSINGSLTITGGDINSTVSNAETPNQTITNHLDGLYAKTNDINAELTQLKTADLVNLEKSAIAEYTRVNGYTEDDNSVTYKVTVDEKYKDYGYLYFYISGLPTGSTIDKNKFIVLEITYSDGTTLRKTLYSNDSKYLTLNKLDAFYNVRSYADSIFVIARDQGSSMKALNVVFNDRIPILRTVSIISINWQDNEEGTGFKYVPPIPVSGATVSYSVLSVSKYVGGKYTTAIVDYSIENNVITIYSDEKFDGQLAYSYKVE